MGGFLLVILTVTLQKTPTLASGLLQRHLPVPGEAPELERPITSYSVLDDNSRFVIAYYPVEPDDLLHELRVRSFDKRTRVWRSATFPGPIGSVLRFSRTVDTCMWWDTRHPRRVHCSCCGKICSSSACSMAGPC